MPVALSLLCSRGHGVVVIGDSVVQLARIANILLPYNHDICAAPVQRSCVVPETAISHPRGVMIDGVLCCIENKWLVQYKPPDWWRQLLPPSRHHTYSDMIAEIPIDHDHLGCCVVRDREGKVNFALSSCVFPPQIKHNRLEFVCPMARGFCSLVEGVVSYHTNKMDDVSVTTNIVAMRSDRWMLVTISLSLEISLHRIYCPLDDLVQGVTVVTSPLDMCELGCVREVGFMRGVLHVINEEGLVEVKRVERSEEFEMKVVESGVRSVSSFARVVGKKGGMVKSARKGE